VSARQHQPSRPFRLWLRVAGDGLEVTCDLCGLPVETGESFYVFDTAPTITHDRRCPPRWTPVVIAGGQATQARAPTGQRKRSAQLAESRNGGTS